MYEYMHISEMKNTCTHVKVSTCVLRTAFLSVEHGEALPAEVLDDVEVGAAQRGAVRVEVDRELVAALRTWIHPRLRTPDTTTPSHVHDN